jgi:hypothetical protein
MLDCKIAPPGAKAPKVPDESRAGVTVWRDRDGVACAYGHASAYERWVHVLGVGAFSFAAGRAEVVAYPLAEATPHLVADAFHRTVLPLALQALGREVLHASAVHMGDGVVAFGAVSETGKSTVAYALSRRGHSLWADDAVCFETSPHAVRAVPLPFALRLRPASAAFFGATPNGTVKTPSPAPLAAVVLLARAERGTAHLHRLPAADAFPETLAHGYSYSIDDPERTGRMASAYLDLVDRVPVFRLTFPDGLERIDAMVDLIELTLAGSPATRP